MRAPGRLGVGGRREAQQLPRPRMGLIFFFFFFFLEGGGGGLGEKDEKQEVGSVGWGRGEVRRRAPGSPTHGHPSQPPSGASGLAWGTEVGRGPADGPRLRSRVNVGYGQAESPDPREEEPRACLPGILTSGFSAHTLRS